MRPCSQCGTLVPGAICPSCKHTPRSSRSATWALLGLTLVGTACQQRAVALYGAPACVDDADGDFACADEDCNDNDDTVFPGAQEIAGDGIDSNCDGLDDPAEQ